jgi:hypothetical protein
MFPSVRKSLCSGVPALVAAKGCAQSVAQPRLGILHEVRERIRQGVVINHAASQIDLYLIWRRSSHS